MERSFAIISARITLRPVFVNKRWNYWIFSKPVRHSPLPFALLKFKARFLQMHSQDTFAYWVTAGWWFIRAEMFGSRKVSVSEFLAKIIENPDFLEGKCYFFTVLCPNIPSMSSWNWFADAIWSISGLESLADNFLVFQTIWPKIFEQIAEFSKKIFCIIESEPPSACLNVMHISLIEEQNKQSSQQRVVMQIWTGRDFFSWIYRQKFKKKENSLSFVDSSKNFPSTLWM